LFLMLGYAFYRSSQPTDETRDPLTKEIPVQAAEVGKTPN